MSTNPSEWASGLVLLEERLRVQNLHQAMLGSNSADNITGSATNLMMQLKAELSQLLADQRIPLATADTAAQAALSLTKRSLDGLVDASASEKAKVDAFKELLRRKRFWAAAFASCCDVACWIYVDGCCSKPFHRLHSASWSTLSYETWHMSRHISSALLELLSNAAPKEVLGRLSQQRRAIEERLALQQPSLWEALRFECAEEILPDEAALAAAVAVVMPLERFLACVAAQAIEWVQRACAAIAQTPGVTAASSHDAKAAGDSELCSLSLQVLDWMLIDHMELLLSCRLMFLCVCCVYAAGKALHQELSLRVCLQAMIAHCPNGVETDNTSEDRAALRNLYNSQVLPRVEERLRLRRSAGASGPKVDKENLNPRSPAVL